jgi:hypothetical protein
MPMPAGCAARPHCAGALIGEWDRDYTYEQAVYPAGPAEDKPRL